MQKRSVRLMCYVTVKLSFYMFSLWYTALDDKFEGSAVTSWAQTSSTELKVPHQLIILKFFSRVRW